MPPERAITSPAQQLLSACWALLAGLAITTVWQFSVLQFLVCCGVVLVVMVCGVQLASARSAQLLVKAVTVGLLVGMVRGFTWQLSVPPDTILGQTNTIRGKVVSEFIVKNFSGSFVLEPERGSRVLVQVASDRSVMYGDRVTVTGKLELPAELDTFNYPRYLASRGIVAQLKAKTMIVTEPAARRFSLAPLVYIKTWLIRRLSQAIPTPANGLVAGMLVGDKAGIPSHWLDAFTVSGLSHIVAVSGYNVSIIIGVLAGGYRWFGRRRLLLPLLGLLVAFALLTGGSSSVWRAALMAMLLLVGQYLGRQYDARTALWLSAAILALINPLVVIADVGFQLSVLATAGIIYGVPLYQFLVPERFRDNPLLLSAAVSLCAIVATAPVIMYQFGQVSLVALPTNIVVVPFVPVLMMFGVLSMLPLIGNGAGWVAGLLVEYLMNTLLWVAQLPFAQRPLRLTLIELFAVLGVLMLFAWLGNRCWQLSRRVNL